eukprot:SAG31_NODE_31832_length_363_cov_1.170455_1_plen_56_part_10
MWVTGSGEGEDDSNCSSGISLIEREEDAIIQVNLSGGSWGEDGVNIFVDRASPPST